jgi:cytolysin-activating lysine-acyltransferase
VVTPMNSDTWQVTDFSHPHSILGAMLWIMQYAPYHSQWALHDLEVDILPPIALGQYRLYHTPDGEPFGFVTWAYVSEAVKDILVKRKRPMEWNDWNSGELLMFNDFVAPFGHGRWMVRELRSTLFADRVAFSLRRDLDGKVRKINRWEGIAYRHEMKRGVATANPRPPHLDDSLSKTRAMA